MSGIYIFYSFCNLMCFFSYRNELFSMDKNLKKDNILIEKQIPEIPKVNVYINKFIQPYYLKETETMDVLCDGITDLKVTTESIVTNCESILSYEQLETLANSKPEELIYLLVNDNNFMYTLNQCTDITVLIFLMDIFSKIILQFNEIKFIIIDMICNSTYLENMNHSLIELTKSEDTICHLKLKEFFINCNTLLEAIENQKTKTLLNEIIQFKTLLFNETLPIDGEKTELNNDYLDTEIIMHDTMINKTIENNLSVLYVVKRWPQYYKTLTAYPLISDITSKEVILSQNIMKGCYDNVDHYIDVQFRLLREDFIAPMREGIQCYKELNKLNQNVIKMPNMHIYFGVKIGLRVFNNMTSHVVNFYTKDDCSIDSKIFMFKSMLVFSNDNFDTMFFASVIRMIKKPTSLLKTIVIKPLDYNVTINMKSSYTMAESNAFFLPYMCTMNVLKTLNHTNFPMKSYIVHGKTEPKTPAYLTYKSKIYNINGLQFDILNDHHWPDSKFLGLDPAQSMAFKAALTEEFTVIQGPPGTGKTFIGLKIARSIIENMYKTNVLKNPIIVVCYTNHALDQFLEGLINITQNITRIGGGCKSDLVKSYVLRDPDSTLGQTLLNSSYVVGFTTTGASMRHSLLLKLKPPIGW